MGEAQSLRNLRVIHAEKFDCIARVCARVSADAQRAGMRERSAATRLAGRAQEQTNIRASARNL
jgi:hypothetical protein